MRRCEYCKSIWVCWNWIHAFGGDMKAFAKANPHIPEKDLKPWGHECWKCEGCQDTKEEVKDGIPYWVLTTFYKWFNK